MGITAEDVVRGLKSGKRSMPAKIIGEWLGTDSRAVATALRKPVKDGRVSCTYRRGIAWYRFKRLKPKLPDAQSARPPAP